MPESTGRHVGERIVFETPPDDSEVTVTYDIILD